MAAEVSPSKNPAGVYEHPETKARLTVHEDPITGSAQADGVVRVGFQYIGTEDEVNGETNKPGKDTEEVVEQPEAPFKKEGKK